MPPTCARQMYIHTALTTSRQKKNCIMPKMTSVFAPMRPSLRACKSPLRPYIVEGRSTE